MRLASLTPKVLHDAESRHRELRLKFNKRAAVTLKQPVDQAPTAWVSKGAKDLLVLQAQNLT